ncbi:MAG: deferrochelatase/peroxidase EfeB [Solirubrobacteraceae bacterium]|nr:deferrochelatase/peroxidase EfeB [Solirubrobacteraceae bacterium]
MGREMNRRRFLGAAGIAAGGLAAGGAIATALDGGTAGADGGDDVVPYYGVHQAGITTPTQSRLHIAAFDVLDGASREDVRDLMRRWSAAAARMSEGRSLGDGAAEALAPPPDTGEADDLPPSRLTVTIGFGPTLFERDGRDRFGLAARRPAALRRIEALPGDELDPLRSGGDLCVQACAEVPEVAFHAVRNLARIGRGVVVMRWSQLGFGRTAKTVDSQQTPRNLMGFKDGTNNITADEHDALARWVWAGAEAPAWMRGGTYMVTRRIRMLIEVWDRASLADQEATIGRHKSSGAPLGRGDERDKVDLRARSAAGPVVPADAHIRLAAPATNDGVRILRRGYSFTDGFDPELGQLDAGLFFIAFQRDAHKQFAVVQRTLGPDALSEYIKHISSGLFAVAPGVADARDYVGRALFEG